MQWCWKSESLSKNFRVASCLERSIRTQCKQTQYLIGRAILEKMCRVYVTYVANVYKGQWHIVTLVLLNRMSTFSPVTASWKTSCLSPCNPSDFCLCIKCYPTKSRHLLTKLWRVSCLMGAEAPLWKPSSLPVSYAMWVAQCVHPSYNHIKIQISLFLIKLGR